MTRRCVKNGRESFLPGDVNAFERGGDERCCAISDMAPGRMT